MTATARRFTVVPMTPKRKKGAWGPLAPPVFPNDTHDRMRAQSLLTGIEFRDHASVAPLLPIDQARDVIAALSRPPTSSLLVAPSGGWWAGLFSKVNPRLFLAGFLSPRAW